MISLDFLLFLFVLFVIIRALYSNNGSKELFSVGSERNISNQDTLYEQVQNRISGLQQDVTNKFSILSNSFKTMRMIVTEEEDLQTENQHNLNQQFRENHCYLPEDFTHPGVRGIECRKTMSFSERIKNLETSMFVDLDQSDELNESPDLNFDAAVEQRNL
jgi:hypothetical protein